MNNAKIAPLVQNGRTSAQETFVRLCGMYMYTKFHLPTTKWAAIYAPLTSVWPRPLPKISDSENFHRGGHVC